MACSVSAFSPAPTDCGAATAAVRRRVSSVNVFDS